MANVQQNSNDNLAGIKLGQQLLASGMDGVKERLKNARAKIDDTKKRFWRRKTIFWRFGNAPKTKRQKSLGPKKRPSF